MPLSKTRLVKRLLTLLALGIAPLSALIVYAAPPASPYIPGEILAPTCAPGDTNCFVDIRLVEDDEFIGFSSTEARIEFDDQATDEINFLDTKVGIGTSSPEDLFEVHGEGDADIDIFMAGTSDSITIHGHFSRGTLAAPTIVQDHDSAISLEGRVYDGTDFNDIADITFAVDGTPGVDDTPGRIEFYTTPAGSDDDVEVMRIDNQGRVGIGTDDPEAPLVVYGPLGGNGEGTEIRLGDGSNLRIYETGATDTDELTIYGDEGIHLETDEEAVFINSTGLNDEELHIGDDSSSDTAISIENNDSGSSHVYEIHVEDDDEFYIYENENENRFQSVIAYHGPSDTWGFGQPAPDHTDGDTSNDTHLFSVDTSSGDAYLSTGGVWTDASSREFKESIEDLSYEEAMRAFQELSPKSYHYKNDQSGPYLGFIAEEVPELVAMPDRKGLAAMDFVAVLTKIVQKQQEQIAELQGYCLPK